jgi:hypothetical protein
MVIISLCATGDGDAAEKCKKDYLTHPYIFYTPACIYIVWIREILKLQKVHELIVHMICVTDGKGYPHVSK